MPFMNQKTGTTGIEAQKISRLARAVGLDLDDEERDRLALTVRQLSKQVRAAEAEFEHDDPFPAYLA